MDEALVALADQMAEDFSIAVEDMRPHEVCLSPEDAENAQYACLRGPNQISSRFALIQRLNCHLQQDLTSLISLPVDSISSSVLKRSKHLFFRETKLQLLRRWLLDSAQRSDDDSALPEVVLDPLTVVGRVVAPEETWFVQALVQLRDHRSSELSVPVASGGDPLFPFRIRLTGEEVLGNSGSFRQFLSRACQELSLLSLTSPCLQCESHKGYFHLTPGPLDLVTEEWLKFFGQLLGMALRAGVPLELPLMPTFWKSLLGIALTDEDLRQFDPVTHKFIADVESALDMDSFLEEHQYPRFVYPSLCGGTEEHLCPRGANIYLSMANRADFVRHLRQFRLGELMAANRMEHVRAGLSTLVPLSLMDVLFTPADVELAICGVATVDLCTLKRYTIYQSGLCEAVIARFWSALESLSREQLRNFVRFACNQERLPQVPPDLASPPPPFPMKLAPSDRAEEDPDKQNIRAETCMFMVKLPAYRSVQAVREKIIFAANSALDPLSG